MSARRYEVRRTDDGVEVVEVDTGATWLVVREEDEGFVVIRTQRVAGRTELSEIWDDETARHIERELTSE
jgi:hypothetical protein